MKTPSLCSPYNILSWTFVFSDVVSTHNNDKLILIVRHVSYKEGSELGPLIEKKFKIMEMGLKMLRPLIDRGRNQKGGRGRII